jgi:hypothetical protein
MSRRRRRSSGADASRTASHEPRTGTHRSVDNGADLAVSGLRSRAQAGVSIGEVDRPAKDEPQACRLALAPRVLLWKAIAPAPTGRVTAWATKRSHRYAPRECWNPMVGTLSPASWASVLTLAERAPLTSTWRPQARTSAVSRDNGPQVARVAIDPICREIFGGSLRPCPAVAPRSTTENRGVAGSIPALAILRLRRIAWLCHRAARVRSTRRVPLPCQAGASLGGWRGLRPGQL